MSVRRLPTGPLSGGERPFLRPRSKVRKWRISAVQAVTPKARLRLNHLLICAWRIEAACKRNDRKPDTRTCQVSVSGIQAAEERPCPSNPQEQRRAEAGHA